MHVRFPKKTCNVDRSPRPSHMATGMSGTEPAITLLPAEAVFPFGAHKGNTIAHVASVDRQHLAYFAGNYANASYSTGEVFGR